jgi:EmrB/QacA subfamily drug resistance transporter
MLSERQPHRYLSEQVNRRELTLMIGGLMMALFLASLNQSIVNTAIPRIVAELNGFETYAWIITAYMLTSTSVVPIVGKLGDLYGRKPFLVAGTAYFVVTTMLCGLAQDMPQLIALRALQGLGGGVLLATTFATIAYVLPPAQRARMNGLFTGMFSLSSVLGPLVGGYLTDNLSWRAVFYVNVPFGLAALLVLWCSFPEVHRPRSGTRLPIDVRGAVVLVVATVLLLLGLSFGGHGYAWGSPQIVGLFSGAVVALVFFVWIESRAADPIVPLGLFRNNVISIAAFGAVVQSMGLFGSAVFIPLFVQGVIGANATISGSVIAPMTITMLLASVTNGQLIARTGRYKPFALGGFVVGTAGLLLLSTMGTTASYVAILATMVLLGFGVGFVGPTLTLASQSAARPSQLGVVTSLLQFGRSVGNTVGTAIFGSILTLRFAPEVRAALPDDLAGALPASVMAMTQNPQALVDPAAASVLRMGLLESLPSQPEAMDLIFGALRSGLAGSLHWVFLAAACVFGSGALATLFLREVPIPGRGQTELEKGKVSGPAPSPSPDLARSGRTDSPPALTA